MCLANQDPLRYPFFMRSGFPPIRLWHVAVLVAVVTFLTYAPFLRNPFVSLDDNYLIYDNPAVQAINRHTLAHVFTSYDPQLYIPLTFVSYQLNWAIAGNTPWVFHLTNLLLHIGSALLLLLIIYQLTGSQLVAFFVSIVFAIHPLNTEAVLWAAARKDVLAGFFFFLSLYAYLRYREREDMRFLIGSIIVYALALLSKVSVIPLPLVLLLLDWLEGRGWGRRVWLEKAPYFACAFLMGIIAVAGKSKVVVSWGFLLNFLLTAKSTLFYILKMFVPAGFSVIYAQIAPVTLASPVFLGSMIGLLALSAAFLLLFFLNRAKMVAFGLGVYLMLLIPNFINFWKNGFLFFAADRYAYLAGVGIFFLVGLCLRWLEKNYRPANLPFGPGAALACVIPLILIPLTMVQARTWGSSEAMYRNVIALYPDSAFAHNNLGLELDKQGKKDEAMQEYKKAVALAPDSSIPYFNIASDESDADSIATYETIILSVHKEEIGNEAELSRFFWLETEFDNLGRPDDTLKLLQRLEQVVPQFPDIHSHLAMRYLNAGDRDAALQEFEMASKLGSMDPTTYYHLAELYSDQNRTRDVIRVLQKGVSLDPTNTAARFQLQRFQDMLKTH